VKKIAFYVRTLNHRGTTQSILDYAKYNEEILGNKSVIIQSAHTEDDVVRNIAKRFIVRTIDSWKEMNKFVSGYDLFYAQKLGRLEEPFIKSTKSVVHAVFQFYEPHEDCYAYISEWLSDFMLACGNPRCPWVPYIVDLPKPDQDTRKFLGISETDFVYGRLGGYDTFDLEFVQEAIIDIVNTRNDIKFVFPNTKPFYKHENIIHMSPIFDRQVKSNYIGMCDAMIHARALGETFGLANAEFLFHNKPVLAWEEGEDRNHIRMLQPFDLLYTKNNVKKKLLEINRPPMDYTRAVAVYTPEKVMKKFDEVFIQ